MGAFDDSELYVLNEGTEERAAKAVGLVKRRNALHISGHYEAAPTLLRQLVVNGVYVTHIRTETTIFTRFHIWIARDESQI